MLSTLLLAGSLSADAFGIGCAYGLKQIKIPIVSRALIGLLSFGFTLLSVPVARFLHMLLPHMAEKYISVVILLFLGLYMIGSGLSARHSGTDLPCTGKAEPKIRSIGIRSLGLSIMIIRDPQCADLNHSKSIDISEALYVGLALSLDAIGACVGFGLDDEGSFLLPVAVGVFQYLFLSTGLLCGSRLKAHTVRNEKFLSALSGVIVIAVALVRLFR